MEETIGMKKIFNKERVLICVRGVPGSGKSTFAEMIARPGIDKIFTADAFFEDKNGTIWIGSEGKASPR